VPSIAIEEQGGRYLSLLAAAESGEEVVFTRSGRPVARLELVPVVTEADTARALAVLDEMDAHARAMNLGPFDWEEWKAYRDEGRR
jgi:antitoxin (DNA-binding transcriptional repressor) of toxin-antitoxin stability system